MKSYTYHDIRFLAKKNDIVVAKGTKDSGKVILKNWIM